jgi:MFS family permease
MHSETSSTDKTMDLYVEKVEAATGHVDGEKHDKNIEGDHHVMNRKILRKLDIR